MSHTAGDAGSLDTGLVLRPFAGLRYAPEVVDLAAVTSPPYDLIGTEEARRLEAREPHNLVRLTLPDPAAADGAKYARAKALLDRWRGSGVLRHDAGQALYVYEEQHGDRVHRGLLGALGLRDPAEHVVLPHEDVHPGPVADRVAQMRATGANLEPIYLLATGTAAAAEVVAAAAATAPLLTAHARTTPDDTHAATYRLWAVTDQEQLATVTAALHGRQALIADGHHRYAAYRTLQAEHREAGATVGGWDFGLAFLVDAAAYPPTLQPIHRVVTQLDPAALLAALPAGAAVHDAGTVLDDALAALTRAAEETSHAHSFLVAGDGRYRVITLPELSPARAGAHSAAWRGLDVSVLHEAVLDGALGVPQERLVFAHTATDAVHTAHRTRGVAVLLNPPTVDEVFAVAAAHDRMPRKSTSFGPKPRNGLVMRVLD